MCVCPVFFFFIFKRAHKCSVIESTFWIDIIYFFLNFDHFNSPTIDFKVCSFLTRLLTNHTNLLSSRRRSSFASNAHPLRPRDVPSSIDSACRSHNKYCAVVYTYILYLSFSIANWNSCLKIGSHRLLLFRNSLWEHSTVCGAIGTCLKFMFFVGRMGGRMVYAKCHICQRN